MEPKENEAAQASSNSESLFIRGIAAGRDSYRGRHHLDTLQRIRRRKQAFDEVFATGESLSIAINRSPSVVNTMRAIETAVMDNQPALRRLGSGDEIVGSDVVAQFQALVTRYYVDPNEAFPSIPSMPSLCELQEAHQHFKSADDTTSRQDQLDVVQALTVVQQFLTNRWYILTGGSLTDQPDLSVGHLTARKAPVPWRTSWSPELYRLEAERMGNTAHVAQSQGPTSAGSSTDAAMTELEASRASAAGNACDIEHIYELAGTQPPRMPSDGEPRYTFPGRLNTNEDIYYDYAVVLPVDECGPFREERIDRDRDLDAARVLGGKAMQIVAFLEDMQLADALGFRDPVNRANLVITDIRELIDAILAVGTANSTFEVGRIHHRIRQMTGLLRAIAQSEMLLAPLRPEAIDDVRVRLEAALNALPAMQLVYDEKINTDRNSSPPVSYLDFPGPPYLFKGDVRLFSYDWWTAPPGFSIDANAMVNFLGPYLEFLGGEFYNRLSDLRARADEARAMLVAIQQPGTAFRHNFKDLASELVYSAIFALAEILEAAASTLALLPKERGEGSKRLALLVVYRQHWFPAGYVQGKLVGYKNLAPNQSEKVLRRTFVKTTRETSTVEEFAATRAQEYSQTQRETAEFVREMSTKFSFSVTASASFDILLASVDVQSQTAFELASNSRSTQSRLSEAAMKTSVNYNEKREIKVREQIETEDVMEVTTAIENRNQEITANYFYYQLLRDYVVRTELYDLRPVLLRARDAPRPAAVDAQFLSQHAHELIPALPAQLAADLQATLSSYDSQARTLVRRRSEATQRRLDLETGRMEVVPTDPELARQRNARIELLARASSDARTQMHEAEQEYLTSRARIERVIAHVRENLCFYMQFIWTGSPVVDHHRVLAEETFGGVPLPYLTRGLMRHGFYGNEEMFEFDGTSYALLDVLCRNLKSGEEFLSRGEAVVSGSPTLELLAQKYHTGSLQDLVARVRDQLFVRDPANSETVLDERAIQLAQDALVVETIPGQVPLLEGFKMAHRMLDVQGKCLENAHLRERIVDRPWQRDGEDAYRVYRREGESTPVVEKEPAGVSVP